MESEHQPKLNPIRAFQGTYKTCCKVVLFLLVVSKVLWRTQLSMETQQTARRHTLVFRNITTMSRAWSLMTQS